MRGEKQVLAMWLVTENILSEKVEPFATFLLLREQIRRVENGRQSLK